MSDDGQQLMKRKALMSTVMRARSRGGMAVIDAILDQPGAASLVRALEPEEFHALIGSLGKGDCSDLLRLASEEQLQGLVDLDAWVGSAFLPERLEELIGLTDAAGEEVSDRLFQSMDDETAVLYLKKRTRIIARTFEPEQEDELTDDLDVLMTPDTLYYLVMPADDQNFVAVYQFLERLYARDHLDTAAVLKHARFEDTDILERETARFRGGRVRNMGFPSVEESESLFDYVNPVEAREIIRRSLDEPELREPETGTLLPALMNFEDNLPPFLQAALQELYDPAARTRLTEGVAYLANAAMVWETGGDLADVERCKGGILRTLAMLNLGLEYVSDQSAEVAARVLLRVWPNKLFQLGFSLTLLLRQQAERLLPLSGRDAGFFLFDPPMNEAVRGVFLPIPQYYEGLMDPEKHSFRDFYTVTEFRNTRTALNQAEGVAKFVASALKLDIGELQDTVSEELRPFVTHTTLMATALINAILGRVFLTRPVPVDDLPAVIDLVLLPGPGDERRLNPGLEQALQRFLGKEENRFAVALFELSLRKLEHLFLRFPADTVPERKYMAPYILVE